jgi:hypothetical protein
MRGKYESRPAEWPTPRTLEEAFGPGSRLAASERRGGARRWRWIAFYGIFVASCCVLIFNV